MALRGTVKKVTWRGIEIKRDNGGLVFYRLPDGESWRNFKPGQVLEFVPDEAGDTINILTVHPVEERKQQRRTV